MTCQDACSLLHLDHQHLVPLLQCLLTTSPLMQALAQAADNKGLDAIGKHVDLLIDHWDDAPAAFAHLNCLASQILA